MTLVVPYDSSPLARAALVRADQLSGPLEESVVVVSVIRGENAADASEKGWIEPGASFDRDAIVATLREEVAELCPAAELRIETVDTYAPKGTIARRIRRAATAAAPSMVIIGSENAGRLVTRLSSVGGSVASNLRYDVLIVRRPID